MQAEESRGQVAPVATAEKSAPDAATDKAAPVAAADKAR